MFSAARCLVPCLYPHPHAADCRHAPAPTAVSAKPRRSSRGSRRERSWDDNGGSESDIDDGFFGQEQDEEEPAPSSGRPAPAAPQLRGSDVLRALQRAAAAKEAARNQKKDVKKPAARQRLGKKKPEGGDVEAREVRTVVIRPEWAPRIRELDLRVQQLTADKFFHTNQARQQLTADKFTLFASARLISHGSSLPTAVQKHSKLKTDIGRRQ